MSGRERRRTRLLLVWSVLIVLGIAIAFTELQRRRDEQTQAAAPDAREQMVLPIALREVGAIEIAALGSLHRFEKDANGAWFYHGAHAAGAATDQHQPDPAMDKLITERLLGLERAKLERKVKLERDLKDYGLANPETILLVYRGKDTQPLAQYAFGAIAQDTVSQYVMRIGAPEAWTIAAFHVDNLIGLVKSVLGK